MLYDKWKQPGWRIEQKYSTKVLIGNWAEERQQVSLYTCLTDEMCRNKCVHDTDSVNFSKKNKNNRDYVPCCMILFQLHTTFTNVSISFMYIINI